MLGVDVTSDDPRYHVSGHANRPDIARLHEVFNPSLVVPMHGEYRHLASHAALAQENQRRAAVAPNGSMVALSGSRAGEVIDEVSTGRLYLDGP